jgi:hypothetical protein
MHDHPTRLSRIVLCDVFALKLVALLLARVIHHDTPSALRQPRRKKYRGRAREGGDKSNVRREALRMAEGSVLGDEGNR